MFQERLTLGSGDCDIVIPDPGVAWEHAEILFRDGILGVRDLGSERGTWQGTQRIHRTILKASSRFRVGPVTIEVVSVRAGRHVAGGPMSKPDDKTRVHDPRSLRENEEDAHPRPAMFSVPESANGRGAPMNVQAPVIVAEANARRRQWIEDALRPLEPTVFENGAALLDTLRTVEGVVLILGRDLDDLGVPQLLRLLPGRHRVRLISAGTGVETSDAEIFYEISMGMRSEDIIAVVQSAARSLAAEQRVVRISLQKAALRRKVRDTVELVRNAATIDELCGAIVRAAAQLLHPARSFCVFHDAESGELRLGSPHAAVIATASSGVVGFVARTRRAVHATRANLDPRYCAAVDTPDGVGEDALLAVPIVASISVAVVVVATRDCADGPFSAEDRDRLVALGRALGPAVGKGLEAFVGFDDGVAGTFDVEVVPDADIRVVDKDEPETTRTEPSWGLSEVLEAEESLQIESDARWSRVFWVAFVVATLAVCVALGSLV